MISKKAYRSRHYEIRLLVFGLMLLSVGLYELPTIWTFKSSLTPVTGTLYSADVNVTTVSSKGSKSQKSELIFYLNESPQKYSLVENIGSEYRNSEYEKILQGLRAAKRITIWIKTGDVDEDEPKVFQIDGDNFTLLDFETVRTEKTPIVIFLLTMGTGCFLLVLRMRRFI